jgi:hypothetical protein
MTSDDASAVGTNATAATKTDSTSSAKAAARKKYQQQKNQKANPPTKKKQPPPPQAAKPVFEGIASGVSPMKDTVIAQGNGNMPGQFRVFQKKLAGAAADDKAYGLDSAILTPVIENGIATGENKVVCFDPVMKEQMDAEYNMDLKIQSSNWNQYQRHEEGFYRTAIGNVEMRS